MRAVEVVFFLLAGVLVLTVCEYVVSEIFNRPAKPRRRVRRVNREVP